MRPELLSIRLRRDVTIDSVPEFNKVTSVQDTTYTRAIQNDDKPRKQ